MAAATSRNLQFIYFVLLLAAFSAPAPSSADDNSCVYTVYIRTGSIFKAGTDSIISATFSNVYNESVHMDDLEIWGGLMGPGYNYFERGNLDIFSGRGNCLTSPICALNLTSDGSGSHHGWDVSYLEVTSAGVHAGCSQTQFTIEQWLATDTSPYQLTAIRDYCTLEVEQQRGSLAIASSA